VGIGVAGFDPGMIYGGVDADCFGIVTGIFFLALDLSLLSICDNG